MNILFFVYVGDELIYIGLLGYMGVFLYQAILQVDLDVFCYNLEVYCLVLKLGIVVVVMVKVNVYGVGLIEIGRVLEWVGVDYFVVVYVDEGFQLCRVGVVCLIMVLNMELVVFEYFVQGQLELVVYYFLLFKVLVGLLEEYQADMLVYLEFNIGMNCLGFEIEEVVAVGDFIFR